MWGVRRDERRLKPEATTPGHAVAALCGARHEQVLWGAEAVSVDRVRERAMHVVVLVQDGVEANAVLRGNVAKGAITEREDASARLRSARVSKK